MCPLLLLTSPMGLLQLEETFSKEYKKIDIQLLNIYKTLKLS